MSFLCWRLQSWTQNSRWSLTRTECRRRETQPSTTQPHCFWCSPVCSGLSGLQEHLPRACWAPHPPILPSPSLQSCFQATHHITWFRVPLLRSRTCTWPCWTSWGSYRPTSQGCQDLHPFTQVHWLQHWAWCHPQICWRCTQSHCSHLWKRH